MSTRKNILTAFLASVLTIGLAACGGGSDQPEMMEEMPDPGVVSAAAASATAADAAAGAAEAAVQAQNGNMDADPASFGVAQREAQRARAAADAAQAAADAAAAAATTAAAQAQADIAAAKATEAGTARDDAVMYANMVMAADVERNALAAAKTAADEAAGAAEAAADAAEAAAMKVAELTGDDSNQTTAANTAATEARTAADNARSESDMAQAATESGVAEGHQADAETAQMTAENRQGVAEELQREAQVAADASALQNEARDLAAAQDATKDAADSVAAHLTAVQGKAADAQAQATAARAAANQAMSARRDYANANKYAMMAEAESATAQAALRSAMQANTDAQAALTAANAAETSADAEAQQDIAEAADVVAEEAHTGTTGAGMAYMRAEAAAMKASDYAGMNVLDILEALNAEEITAAAAKTTQLSALNTHLAAMAAETTNGNANAATTVAVTWNYAGGAGADGDIATPADNTDPGEGELDIVITPTGGQAADLTPDDPDTAGDDEQNFVKGIGLGDFDEYHITGAADGSGDRTLTIVFTDKEQAKAPIPASTANFQNEVPIASRLSAFVGGQGDTAGSATYDHDGDSRTPGIAVIVTCPTGVTCNAPEDADGNVISITGYRISTASDGVPILAVGEAQDNTYIAFGMWLAIDADGPETFGAFDFGGTATTAVTTVTGTATYNGKAAGVHNMPSATNFFHADATPERKLRRRGGAGVDHGSHPQHHVRAVSRCPAASTSTERRMRRTTKTS